MFHLFSLVASPEDLADQAAFDRVLPRVFASAVEECKPLVGKHPVRHAVVANLGIGMGTRENCAIAVVANEAETEP